jgi:hypothetical protein
VAPPVNFPGTGPDLMVFNVLLIAGVVLALLGHMTGSRQLRIAGIVLLFCATAAFFALVFVSSAFGAAAISSALHPEGARALAGDQGGDE